MVGVALAACADAVGACTRAMGECIRWGGMGRAPALSSHVCTSAAVVVTL